MPLIQKTVQLATKPLPRVLSPRAHFVFDYLTAGAFFASAIAFGRVNRRAALGAAICGAADLATVTLTTRPGGEPRPFSLRAHGQIDLGLASMTAMMPEFLRIQETPQANFFLLQSVLMTAVNGLTDFETDDVTSGKHTRRAA